MEITQAGLRQVQVSTKIGFTFAAAMRAFLRADPDVIMVGEMRDQETASIAVEASLTGHLVLSTLHTNSAPETITRLVDMGLDPFSFADALSGCWPSAWPAASARSCREPYRPSAEEFKSLADLCSLEFLRESGVTETDCMLWRGRGCEECRGSGYAGRVPLHELLVADEEVKRLMQHKVDRRGDAEGRHRRRHAHPGAGRRHQVHPGPHRSVAGAGGLQPLSVGRPAHRATRTRLMFTNSRSPNTPSSRP